MKILWIWEIVLDKTYVINWEIDSWQKTESNDSIVSLWWPVPAALKLLSNLWYKTTIVGSIWKWPLGKFAKNEFKKLGIKDELILDKATKVNSVIVNEITWTRTIIKDKIHNKKLETIPKSMIKNADLIIFDRSEKEAFKYVLIHKKENTKIILDPGTEWNEEIIFMAKNSFIPIFPIETLWKMGNESNFAKNIEELFEIMWKSIIITAGENGAFLYDWKTLENFEASKICSIDSNWAGDIFRWALAHGVLNNWDLRESIIFANKIAWLQCTRKWNLQAVPTKKEINNLVIN